MGKIDPSEDAKESLPYRQCVGIMLINKKGEVWVGRRVDTPDAWQMPQGGIDDGEAPRETALRELEEEIGTASARIVAETEGWLSYDLPPELVGKLWKHPSHRREAPRIRRLALVRRGRAPGSRRILQTRHLRCRRRGV
jgi:8-oxo-dGTP pyrophosphatase MutT (NUDIX family)